MRSRLLLIAVLSIVAAFVPASASAQEPNLAHPLFAPTPQILQLGESDFSMADLYRVSADSIIAVNAPKIGMRTLIPAKQTAEATQTEMVNFGETFAQIALRYGVSQEQLGLINHIVNPVLIFSGQQLDVPSTEGDELEGPLSVTRIGSDQTIWQAMFALNEVPTQTVIANHFSNPYLIASGQTIRLPHSNGDEDELAEPWQSFELHPLPLEPGRTSAFIVQTMYSGTTRGSFLGNDLRLIPDGENRYVALLGIYRWTAPGIYPLSIVFTDDNGVESVYTRPVKIASGAYSQEIIRLSEEDAAVRADAETVQGEAGYIQYTMSGFTPQRFWEGLFRLPAAGIMSSAFGTARSYDSGNSFDIFHAGADFAAPTGTPIYAPATGVVADTASLSVRGYATILDHGWGVYSGFWHQASILVQPGDMVAQGQQIGAVGNTGLSTASHVHWEMWVSGFQIDPLEWAREVFP